LGDAEDEAQKIDEAVSARVSIPSGAPTAQTIYDLSTYSDRILGIGEERPYASPYIAKKQEDGGWFPDNINALIELPPERPGAEPRYVSLDPEVLQRLSQEVAKAAGRGEQTIAVPGALDRISIGEAEDILSTFSRATQDAEAGRLAEIVEQRAVRKARKGLLIKPNIAVVDYLAERRDSLISYASVPTLPTSLLPKVELKQHQLEGVAWLQHLFGRSPKDCRGAVLADDMGLGKTLQLLTLIAWSREQDRELPPALIIAPVALLENWSEELHKFFDPKALPVLEVYGDTLAALRVPPHQVDEQLRRDGLVRFLRRNWVGDAKIVLTTYETLRDLEFSFAAERWSILVCDEAQKIKNPNALVTRAAKKQNARFRIACTGTPVENTLADLWCLFDLVQPGLLGALNEFGQRYRRPIEAQSQEEKLRVEELRGHIQPQILRRLKKDVARDLPKKIDVLACKALPLTTTQRGFYASAIAQYAKRNEPAGSVPFKNALGLLQYLRLICTDPRPHGMAVSLAASTDRYRKTSAKFDWLIPTLKEIQVKQEKALLFCEFRDIQRLLRHYISKELGYSPDIINGDTAASSKNEQSRQKRIRAFQNEPGFGAIILSPLAVGYGVNIQAANHVIHYTRTWNPAKEDQATDRAYRIGQRKDVYVYCPVVVANDFSTFDSKLDELLTRKRTLAEDMLNGAGDVGPGDFDIQEVAPFDVPGSQPRVLTIHDVICLRPRYFEAYVAVLWQRRGFPTVVLGPGAGDGGVDVVAIKGASGELVQCKTSQTHERALGWEAIKEVVGGEAAYRLRYPGVQFQKVCVSNVEFNETAKTQALHNNVRLVDRTELETIQAGQQISLEDIEKLIYRRW
jgi:superfamily II DNA or RNA helicase/Holliday junction resolvase